MTVIDRIKYDGCDDGSPWLIYKYLGEEFVLGSQFIVNQGQEALFLKVGKHLIYLVLEPIPCKPEICLY